MQNQSISKALNNHTNLSLKQARSRKRNIAGPDIGGTTTTWASDIPHGALETQRSGRGVATLVTSTAMVKDSSQNDDAPVNLRNAVYNSTKRLLKHICHRKHKNRPNTAGPPDRWPAKIPLGVLETPHSGTPRRHAGNEHDDNRGSSQSETANCKQYLSSVTKT